MALAGTWIETLQMSCVGQLARDVAKVSFEQMVLKKSLDRLVGGDDFGVDASLIKADASRYTKVDLADWSAPDRLSRSPRT